ncbi:acyltransferase [Rhodococcus sp. IEGM 1343]|uniref:acyltransferase family protein n=1 Tax=Rhodococcus sp. IEGM 1343 TaxID=3082224 RepID=UPI00295467E2|nr:acyltransferase [Rhodococcus sp. IEGM 1343]MDV8055961.1 acyltransferase [Rhodococcus sp. IEGM 1343]
MGTIGEKFDPRHNSLNAIRLILALIVIAVHSWPIGGWGHIPEWHGRDFGNTAVAGFFAISGYLITASRMSTPSIVDYFWRRFLRIYPAYLVALLMVAAVFAPVYTLLTDRDSYAWKSGIGYFFNNFTLYIQQWGIAGTLQEAPYPDVWNGSLWTLYFEALCYVAIGLGVSIVPRRFVVPAVFIGLILTGTYNVLHVWRGFVIHDMLTFFSQLAVYFCAGALLYLLRDKIPMNGWLTAVAACLAILTIPLGLFPLLGALPFAYVMMWLGIKLPLQSVGRKNDFSYGTYIYAMPLQQILVAIYDWTKLPIGVFVALSIACAAPFALLSWFVIEKPAMTLKRLTKKRTDRAREKAAFT